ncbi:MAG TPA: DUF72 domain-containing protein [Acidimicrobiales bacterium]|nr:DUF72 domain-containing protein [Acidimicrobiales bacterium]
MPVLIGTSGWQYGHWRGRLYPVSVPRARWLEHYASRFGTVEVDGTFYRLPEEGTFRAWRERTPPDFVLAVKASRYLTHVRRLRDPAEPVRRLLERAAALGDKLGPVLVQLPGTFRRDLGLLDEALACFAETAPGLRIALEAREGSWYVDDTASVLARRGAALVLADLPGRRAPPWRTAAWGYLRFHGGRATPVPCYGRTALRTRAQQVAALWSPGEDVFAFFNNDACGCAVHDARCFAAAVTRAGLVATRVPPPQEATAGS